MHIVVALSAADALPWMELLRAALPEARFDRREPGLQAEIARRCADYVVLVEPCATVFGAHPRPKAVFTASAGVGHLLRLSNLPADVPVVRLEDAGMAQPMARYALAAALRFAQRMDEYAVRQKDRRWEPLHERVPAEVAAGVLGLGVIGGTVARVLAQHGFSARGYAATAKRIDGIACYAGPADFDAFLSGLDFLVNALPLTPATTGLLNARALSLLADGAHVVNIGRGATLVDADLLALLDGGKLSGATLDVFAKEPLPEEHPFWTHPRIAVTPHVSGLTIPRDAVAQIAAKIRRLERGEAVTGIVDWKRGY